RCTTPIPSAPACSWSGAVLFRSWSPAGCWRVGGDRHRGSGAKAPAPQGRSLDVRGAWPAMPGRARRCRAGAEDTGAPSAWHQLLRHPPLAGEGWGGGQWVASEPAPIPAFPRKRGKGRTAVSPRPARDTPPPPPARGGRAAGRRGPGPIPAFPRKRGRGRPAGSPRPARDTRSLPRLRGGLGWGQWVAADPAPSRPSPASGGRGAQLSPLAPPATPAPSPACGGGLGWGAVGRIGPGPHPGLPPQGGAGRTVVTPRPVRDTRVHGIRHINQIISDRFSP